MNRPKADQKIGPLVEIFVAIVVEEDGDGFHAYTPALKGLHVDGSTQDEATERARKAIDVYLESLLKHGEGLTEGPGLIVRKVEGKKSVQTAQAQWHAHSVRPFGTNLKIPQPTG